MQQHWNPNWMYTTNDPPHNRVSTVQSSTSNAAPKRETLHCTFWNKTGHNAGKCWNKPPYHCLKCKTQGHTLSDCLVKGKKKSTQEESTSQGEGNPAEKGLVKKKKQKTGNQRSWPQPFDACNFTSVFIWYYNWLHTAGQNDQAEGDEWRAFNLDYGFGCNESYDSTCPHPPQHPKILNAKSGDERCQRDVASHWSRNYTCNDKHWSNRAAH